MSSDILDDAIPTPVIPLTRRALRSLFVPRLPGQLLIKPSFTPVSVEVRDISRGGLGLVFPIPLEPGTTIAFQFLPEPWTDLGTLMAQVVYTLPERNEGWRLGCQLARALKRNELAELLSQSNSILRYE